MRNCTSQSEGEQVFKVWSDSFKKSVNDGGAVDALRERDSQLARGGWPLHGVPPHGIGVREFTPRIAQI